MNSMGIPAEIMNSSSAEPKHPLGGIEVLQIVEGGSPSADTQRTVGE